MSVSLSRIEAVEHHGRDRETVMMKPAPDQLEQVAWRLISSRSVRPRGAGKGTMKLTILLLLLLLSVTARAEGPVDIGSRLEPFVDDFLVHRMDGARLTLHRPVPRERVLACDQPWEGNGVNYVSVFQDGPIYRMYYRGRNRKYQPGKTGDPTNPQGVGIVDTRATYCYAVSTDGIHWTKPKLGMFEFQGAKKNNIIWDGVGTGGMCPFKDTNPNCRPEERYKALVRGTSPEFQKLGVRALTSPDGIRWSLSKRPAEGVPGDLDGELTTFWDTARGEYRIFNRKYTAHPHGRDILTASSKSYMSGWSAPVLLKYRPRPVYAKPGDSELYSNGVTPYFRAPHIFLGFPTRYLDRGWSSSMKALPQLKHRKLRSRVSPREGTALTDGMFMASRDGLNFYIWPESFIRPGPQRIGSWFYGDHNLNWGVLETPSILDGAPNELSLYITEFTQNNIDSAYLRRYSLRIDGFASIQAPLRGGELVTKPLVFGGKELVINFSTGAAGSVRVEIQDTEGTPIRGYALADCDETFGDDLERTVVWKGGADVSRLAGRPVRLRFVLKDADLFSLRFADSPNTR